jgi:hypothetical protein
MKVKMNCHAQIKPSQGAVTSTHNCPGFFSKFQSQYDPNNLLNTLIKHFSLKSDAALAKILGISSLIIKNIRNLTQPVTGTILILMHEKTEFSLSELRMYMGDRRQKFRIRGMQSHPLVGACNFWIVNLQRLTLSENLFLDMTESNSYVTLSHIKLAL